MHLHYTDIQPSRGKVGIHWKELWSYRDLFFFLVWRDVLVRYKQTVLGAAWAILQPLASMVVFTIFFGRLAGVPSDGLPYSLFAYSGLVVWSFFSSAMNQSAASLILDEKLVTKVYFPRLLVPAAPVFAGLLDLMISLTLLVVLMACYGFGLASHVWAIVPALTLTLTATMGVGTWLSAMNVKYRDFRYVIPFITQVWMFSSPVVYPASLVPDYWRLLYALNPLTGAIEGFRWALFGATASPLLLMVISSLSAVAILTSGLLYFRNTERFFADLI